MCEIINVIDIKYPLVGKKLQDRLQQNLENKPQRFKLFDIMFFSDPITTFNIQLTTVEFSNAHIFQVLKGIKNIYNELEYDKIYKV